MARIETVDYGRMPAQANEMRGEAKVLNKELAIVYESIRNMHEVWYGTRYNDLVQCFNDMIPSLNDMLTLVVTEIPFALENIANNYSQADCGQKVVVPNNEGPNKLENLAKGNDVGMRFLTSEVNEIKESVSANFAKATELMNIIETIFAKVVWESEAAEAFKAKFKTLKNEIVTSFERTNTEFKKLMEETEQDIEKTEKANTVL